ncbi:alpha/beta hydrolase fold domain-containing protein [Bordetella sp. LUAb4]|uniref:alpha/beta hydrolase fold domain-containing protein n=1 Tax=Bordetella sp. LUAb4 TaxID=2843195 RepID=UPI001E489C2B|nr:alpha/beta hydrolase [Bordetella sp. LUAb4]
MSDMQRPVSDQDHITTFPISNEERARETALRQRFAEFWASANGNPRAVYDTFIGNSPSSRDVALIAVREECVRGWWVCPAQPATGEAILYIHGGGYVLGSAQAYLGFVSQIVSRTGIPALVIDYPLAPEASLPAAPSAALAAYLWMARQGCKRIAIAGDSAGGGLALVTLAQLARLPGAAQPIAGVVFSPWTDLAFTGKSMHDPSVLDPLISVDYLQDCAGKYLGGMQASSPLASPLYGNLQGLPPLLIQAGTDERLLDDSRQYAARAAQAGVLTRLEIWEGMHHVFQLDSAHIESSRRALDRGAAFLLEAFGRH